MARCGKVWQLGNLVARKFLKNQALAESFLIFLLHFLTSKQFGKSVKEMILVFLENGFISYPFFHNIPKMRWKFRLLHFFMGRRYVILWTLSSFKIHLRRRGNFFSCLTTSFLEKVLGPILRLPETLLTFSTSELSPSLSPPIVAMESRRIPPSLPDLIHPLISVRC